jgi:Spy/CpxP family protein refolding chaperone
MSGKWKALLILSLVFNVAVLSTIIYHWNSTSRTKDLRHRRPSRETSIGHRCRRLANRLELSPEKAERFEEIMTASEGETRAVRDRLHVTRGELLGLMWESEPREEAVFEKVDEIVALQGELERILVRRLLETRSILDPDEALRLHEHMERRMGDFIHPESHPRRVPRRNGGKR